MKVNENVKYTPTNSIMYFSFLSKTYTNAHINILPSLWLGSLVY